MKYSVGYGVDLVCDFGQITLCVHLTLGGFGGQPIVLLATGIDKFGNQGWMQSNAKPGLLHLNDALAISLVLVRCEALPNGRHRWRKGCPIKASCLLKRRNIQNTGGMTLGMRASEKIRLYLFFWVSPGVGLRYPFDSEPLCLSVLKNRY